MSPGHTAAQTPGVPIVKGKQGIVNKNRVCDRGTEHVAVRIALTGSFLRGSLKALSELCLWN